VICGLDGWKGQWVCLKEAGPFLSAEVIPLDLSARLDQAEVICIDTPIGLPAAGPRAADLLAREFIRPRGSSVFPAPIRDVLGCSDYREACAISQAKQGKKLSKQAFQILPVIQAVDAVVGSRADFASRIREVHPEVSFRAMADRPLASKHTDTGERQRLDAIAKAFGPWAFPKAWNELGERRGLKKDLIDAFACLWTARRVQQGIAISLPAEPEKDSVGLPMAIWY